MKKNTVSMALSLIIFSSSFLTTNSVFALINNETTTQDIKQYVIPGSTIQRIEGVNFDDFLATLGNDAVIFKYSNGKKALVIKPDGRIEHFTSIGLDYSVVTMRKGTKPPEEEINRTIGANDYSDMFKFLKYTDGDEYRFYPEAYEYCDTIFDILKKDNNVLSIDTRREIVKDAIGMNMSLLFVCSELAPEEISAEYPTLNLFGDVVPEDNEYRKRGYNLVFTINSSCNPDVRLYDDLKKLYDSGMKCEFDPIIAYAGSPVYAEMVNIIYQNINGVDSASYKGDVNVDSTIDVTDLTALSLALLGDMDLTADQQKAADLDGDGAVTLADLARLQQYLSKKIDKL